MKWGRKVLILACVIACFGVYSYVKPRWRQKNWDDDYHKKALPEAKAFLARMFIGSKLTSFGESRIPHDPSDSWTFETSATLDLPGGKGHAGVSVRGLYDVWHGRDAVLVSVEYPTTGDDPPLRFGRESMLAVGMPAACVEQLLSEPRRGNTILYGALVSLSAMPSTVLGDKPGFKDAKWVPLVRDWKAGFQLRAHLDFRQLE